MANIFPRSLVVDKEEKHKKDVRILDGDVTTYGIFRRDKSKIAEIVKFSADGNKTVLAELEWLGDRKDRIKFPGGEWQRVDKAWDHYNVTRDRENYISAFTGADGRKYIWYLQGSIKVLAVGEKSGPIVAKHVDHGRAGTLDLKNEADAAGDMLFITFLAAEGFRGRLHFSWFQAFGAGGSGAWAA